MYVIEATNPKKWHWISGVFERRAEADEYFLAIPEAKRKFQRIIDVPMTFPFFVIEKRGFEYGDAGFVRQRLRELQPADDEDHVHFNVFAILREFRPSVPGADSMGELLHWHITDWDLRPPRSA